MTRGNGRRKLPDANGRYQRSRRTTGKPAAWSRKPEVWDDAAGPARCADAAARGSRRRT